MRGGQASTEYLFLLGMLLVVAIPVWYYSFAHVRDELKQTQLQEVVDKLQISINEVYMLGNQSQEVITLHVPSSVQNFTFSGAKEVIIFLNRDVAGQVAVGELAIPVKPYVVGKLDGTSGVHRVRVWAMNDSLVNVTDVIYQ